MAYRLWTMDFCDSWTELLLTETEQNKEATVCHSRSDRQINNNDNNNATDSSIDNLNVC